MVYTFFFSSRRPHTRYWRDWSSDVCSSDLVGRAGHPRQWRGAGADLDAADPVDVSRGEGGFFRRRCADEARRTARRGRKLLRRSEERRVGKECRSRWWPYHLKKKT